MRIDKHVYDDIVKDLGDLLEDLHNGNIFNHPKFIIEDVDRIYNKLTNCRKAMHVSELSDEDIESIKNTKMPEGYEYLNDELLDE